MHENIMSVLDNQNYLSYNTYIFGLAPIKRFFVEPGEILIIIWR